MIGYYDYVLGLIPGALVGLTAFLIAAGMDLLMAMPVGAAVAALVAGHALFVNNPVATEREAAGGSAEHPPMNAD
jgi:hypothetical protein